MSAAADSPIKISLDFLNKTPFAKELGFEILNAERGFICLRFNPQERFLNHLGTCQAGAIFALSEITGGLLCGTFLDLDKNFLITKKAGISFDNIADSVLISEASLPEEKINEVILLLNRKRKIDFDVAVLIKDDKGRQISKGQNSYYVRLGIPRSFISRRRG